MNGGVGMVHGCGFAGRRSVEGSCVYSRPRCVLCYSILSRSCAR